jgi:type IV fimbrial biogenesis protein FimU
MRHGYKGFTLVELMVTIAVLAILVTVGIPSFVSLMNNTKADTESTDLYRALNYARLEAINRGVNVRITPGVANTWTSTLTIQGVSGGAVVAPVYRVIAPMATAAAVTPNNLAFIEYNNLGALATPTAAVAFVYTRGTFTRSIGVCLNGRVVLGGSCP